MNIIHSLLKNNRFCRDCARMWVYVRPFWFWALMAMVICIPIGALDSVIALFLKPYTDNVVVAKNMDSPWYIPLLIVGFTTLQGLLNYASQYLNTWVGGKLTRRLRAELYDRLLEMDAPFFDSRTSGEVMLLFNSDADTACSGLLDNMKRLITRVFSSVALVGVLIYNSWQLSIMAVLIMAVALAPVSKMRRMLRSLVDRNVDAGFKVNSAYNETFAGNRTITSYNLQQSMKDRFNGFLQEIFDISLGMIRRTGWITPFAHFIVSIGLGLAIALGSWMIVTEQITPGEFVSFLAALIMLYTPLKNISNVAASVQVSFIAMERMFGSLDRRPSVAESPDAGALDAVERGISLKDVTFGYGDGPDVLHGVSLDVRVGQVVALVGNSGGGKSTVVSLLPRFYDVRGGSVMIDGRDVRDIRLKDLRRSISFVFQDNFLFEGTIRENIMLGRADATERELESAVRSACLTEFIGSLEKGLDTEVGERGVLLSGGQKQRVAIARAFLKDAPIVVLDEATSALDNRSEKIVQQAIDNLMRNKTVFVIAHRLSTVMNADIIAVMNDGRLCEQGTHGELVAKEGGIYRMLYEMQFSKTARSPEETEAGR
ncbi:MAG: ATP-binding cassette domain-containing protein [Mailhella sp.]|nr:ATP-binding cassette domain-containing protein [Mailhella sp.]